MIKGRHSNFRRNATLAALACVAASLTCASAATVHGATDAAVVWVSAPAAAPHANEAEMRNRDRTFIPPLIVIPVGASVRFPNDDPFYHSIYSESSNDPFDIGYYDNGPGKVVTFAKPGIVDVRCHIHAQMHAVIIVADGPFTQATAQSYTLTGVPAGKHELHTWDAAHGEHTFSIDVPSEDASVTFDARR